MTLLIRYTLLWVCLLFLGSGAYSQSVVTIESGGKPLAEVLTNLSKEHGVKFAFDYSLSSKIIVKQNYSGNSLTDAVTQMLEETPLECIVINGVYVIRPKKGKMPTADSRTMVSGVVKAKSSGEALPYAKVAVQSAKKHTESNPDGFFAIAPETQDSITIRVTSLGYEPIELKVAPVFEGGMLVVELNAVSKQSGSSQLKRASNLWESNETTSAIVWNSARQGSVPTILYADITAPLQAMPGIDGTAESLAGIAVRRSAADKNAFIYDGFRVYHIDHLFGSFSSFNAKAIKDIRVQKGGFDSRWGGASSAITEISGKTGNTTSFKVDAGLDLLNADLLLEGPLGAKSSFVVALRRSFTDRVKSSLYYSLFEDARYDISSTLKNSPGFTSGDIGEPNFHFYDINAKLSYKPTLKDNLSVSVYKGYDALNYSFNGTAKTINEESDWGNSGVGTRWSRQWSQRVSTVATVGASRYSLDYNHVDTAFRKRQNFNIIDTIRRTSTIDNSLSDFSASLTSSITLAKGNVLEVGVLGNGVNINSSEAFSHYIEQVKITDTTRLQTGTANLLTGYAQYKLGYGVIHALRIGGRANYYGTTDRFYLEPRVQLVLSPVDSFFVKAFAGKYYQFVNRVYRSGANGFRSTYVAANGHTFPVVESNHYSMGIKWAATNGFTIDVEGFIKNTEGLAILQSVYKRSGSGLVETQRLYNLQNRVKGVDVLISKSYSFGESWLSYTLSRSENQADNINRGNWYPALDHQLHELKLASSVRFAGLGLSAIWTYGSGRPWDELLFTSTYQLDPSYDKNSQQLPSYHKLDIGVSYTIKVNMQTLKIGANLFNVYNRQNILQKSYELVDNPMQEIAQGNSPVVYNEMVGRGFTPTFYLNYVF